jgi:c-di-GMP-binding flagellar brake protein YcgR
VETSNQARERRKYPRISLDLPLEYRATSAPNVRGALVINASETGLLVHSIKEMPVGTKLKIVVMFPEEFQLDNFEVLAEVVWKDIQWEEDWEGYQLGLKFIHLLEEDRLKLKQLLADGHEIW